MEESLGNFPIDFYTIHDSANNYNSTELLSHYLLYALLSDETTLVRPMLIRANVNIQELEKELKKLNRSKKEHLKEYL